MVQTILLASFLLGVLIIAGIVALLSRGRPHYTPRVVDEDDSLAAYLGRVARRPVTWTVAFVLLTLLTAGAAVLAVGGFEVSAGVAGAATTVLAVVGAVVLVGYLFYGTFVAARSRGLHSAQAFAFGSWAVGLLVLLGVAASLLGFV